MAFTQINQNLTSGKDIRRYSKEVLKDPIKIQQFQNQLTKDDFIRLNIEINELKKRMDQEKQMQLRQAQLNIEQEKKVNAEREQLAKMIEKERRHNEE